MYNCDRRHIKYFISHNTSENIHLPLIETEEIMDLTVFATLQRLHQFINFASFLHDCHLATYKERLHGLEKPPICCITFVLS